MKKRSRLVRNTTIGLVITQAAPDADRITGPRIHAIEKNDPLVALANLAPLSARESAAFERSIETGRHSSRYPDLSRAHARQLLRVLMGHISEERYAAGWHVGLEFALWEEIQGRPRKGLMPFERTGLKFLSQAAGGWWNFDRFVSTKRWLTIFGDHDGAALQRKSTPQEERREARSPCRS